MLAFSWNFHSDCSDLVSDLANRLATSLCAGIGGYAGKASSDGGAFAYRPLRSTLAQARAWQPSRLSTGETVLFHGHIANRRELGRELGTADDNLAKLYGAALARWDDADTRVIGEYCAVVFNSQLGRVRLARSPLRAPPLHYFRGTDQITAASVPRTLFAVGAPCRINEQRLADSNWMNFSDESASWYEDLARVSLGSIVELSRENISQRRYYDPMSLPDVRLASDEEYVARARELLDEGVIVALEGSRRPGISLSSGLDSPQVATRALKQLPQGQVLPSFTFVPEAGWDGIVSPGARGDEGEMVRAFAALHPQIEAHFTTNEGIAHDHRWTEMFHVMGGAASGLCNMYVFHGVWQLAQQHGCDRLLLAEWGNQTFSAKGEWGFVEYLMTGRWRQLYLALRDHPNDPRSILRRFVALSLVPLLPGAVKRALLRMWHRGEKDPYELISPLSPEFLVRSGAKDRARLAGVDFSRFKPRSVRDARRYLFSNGDCETAETYQAFEQLYGVEQRDPTAYRPFVEFCMGLPTDLFLRNGEMRWLAKQMARGIMPENQRANSLNGRWDADWHLRLGRRRRELRAELEQIAIHPTVGNMIDSERLIAALDDFPPQTSTDPEIWMQLEMGIPRALLTARFVNFVEGRNDV